MRIALTAFLVLALASWVLYRSLLTQLRRVDVRARLQAEEEAAARAAAAAAPAAAGAGDAADAADAGEAAGGAR